MAAAPLPTITGVIGVSLAPVSKPSRLRPALKRAVFFHRRSILSGSASRTSMAAMHAAATPGGCDGLKRNGLARWIRKSPPRRPPAPHPPHPPPPPPSLPPPQPPSPPQPH